MTKEDNVAEDFSRVTSSQRVVGIRHDDRLDALFLRNSIICVLQRLRDISFCSSLKSRGCDDYGFHVGVNEEIGTEALWKKSANKNPSKDVGN